MIPSVATELNSDQSMSSARGTRRDSAQPERSATSRNRCEFDEFGLPTTIIASTSGATCFTASCRLVVA